MRCTASGQLPGRLLQVSMSPTQSLSANDQPPHVIARRHATCFGALRVDAFEVAFALELLFGAFVFGFLVDAWSCNCERGQRGERWQVVNHRVDDDGRYVNGPLSRASQAARQSAVHVHTPFGALVLGLL